MAKQEFKTKQKQLSKQIYKTKTAQEQKSLLLSKLSLKSELTQKQKQKSILASLTISALAQEQASMLERIQTQEKKVLVGLISLSDLARPQISLPKKAAVQLKKPKPITEQLQEYEMLYEKPEQIFRGGLWLPRRKKEKEVFPAYSVWVKRFGKFKKITREPLPKGRALRLGAREVRRTLAATFKLEKAKEMTPIKDIDFFPSPRVFRGYRIKKGKKIF